MRNLSITAAVWFCLVLFLSGCWDRTEINQYAFWMGTLLDQADNGNVKVSAQIAIPSRIGFSGNKQSPGERGNIVISAIGKTLIDTCQRIQDKLPRRLFIGHRRAMFIGEKLARSGVWDSFDMYTRNMDTTLRTSAFVILGDDPEKILKINSPFDPFSANAAVDQDKNSKIGDKAFRDFIVAKESETTCPVLSAIKLNTKDDEEKDQIFDIKHLAVFNRETKMVGTLNESESFATLWILGNLRQYYITGYVPEGKGYLSLIETNLSRKLITRVEKNQVSVHIVLSGKGNVKENRTNLDMMQPDDVSFAQKALERHLEDETRKTIQDVQQKYGTDIFGFGDAVHRQHPRQWKIMKRDWLRIFPEIKVTVDVNLKIKRIGATGKRT